MRAALAIVLMILATAALALDQRLYVPSVVPPIGGTGRDQLLIPNMGAPAPPNPCTGAIDLSEGCPQPMLGL